MEFQLKEFNIELAVTKIANVHYFEFTKEYFTSGDRHPFCELIYVDDGTITVESDAYCGHLSKNELLIHTPGELHSLRCEYETSPSVIIICFECDSPALSPFSYSPTPLTAEQGRLLSDVIREARSVFLPPYDIPNLKDMKKCDSYPFGADQLIKLKLECLLIDLIRGRKIKKEHPQGVIRDSKIHEIRDYITRNFREGINLEELSFLFGTNKTTLCKSFRTEFGTTVISYTNSLRIKEARRLIRDGSESITEISEGLGFSSVHYFDRLFKKLVGKSPGEYIKTIKSRFDD